MSLSTGVDKTNDDLVQNISINILTKHLPHTKISLKDINVYLWDIAVKKTINIQLSK